MSDFECRISKLDTSIPKSECIKAGLQLWKATGYSGSNRVSGGVHGNTINGAMTLSDGTLTAFPDTKPVRSLIDKLVEILAPQGPVVSLRAIRSELGSVSDMHADERPGRRVLAALIGGGTLELGKPAFDESASGTGIGEILFDPGMIVQVDNTVAAESRQRHRFVNNSLVRVAIMVGDEMPTVGPGSMRVPGGN